MTIIFEIKDKTGKRIRLTEKQWNHIKQDHPEVKEEEMKETLQTPLKVIESSKNKFFYYRHFKYRKPPAKFLRTIEIFKWRGICNNILLR